MINKSKLLPLLCALVMVTTRVDAQPDATSIELTLHEAIELALSDNPTIQIANLEVERYDYVRKTTMGGLLPQLAVDGSFNRTLKNQSLAEGFTLGSSQYNTITANANCRWLSTRLRSIAH